MYLIIKVKIKKKVKKNLVLAGLFLLPNFISYDRMFIENGFRAW